MKLLPILACSTNDCVQAEKLLDFMALMKGKNPSGCIVLSFAADLHDEMRVRIKIAAEIGFETVDVFACPKLDGNKGKVEQVNHLFAKTSQHVGANYRLPFLWLEPDVTPMCADWLERLERAYDAQPKLYMGSILSDAEKRRCIGRVGVFPRGCYQDVRSFLEGKIPFEIAAGEGLVARTSRTKLIHMIPILRPEDRARVRNDAVLVHGDKSGILLSALMDEGAHSAYKSTNQTFGTAAPAPCSFKWLDVPGWDQGDIKCESPAKPEEPKTPAQTITGSNARTGAEMPVRITVSHKHESGAEIPHHNGLRPTENAELNKSVPAKIDGRRRPLRSKLKAQPHA